MGRTINSGCLVRTQADFYFPIGSFYRSVGIGIASLTSYLFLNNQLVSWDLSDGTSVPDSSISPGSIYFNEISNSPGFYSVRFLPNQVGFWRLILKNNSIYSESISEYDVVISPDSSNGSGLIARFD